MSEEIKIKVKIETYNMQGHGIVTTGCYKVRDPKNGTMINDMNC
jgi:hypothetical protein